MNESIVKDLIKKYNSDEMKRERFFDLQKRLNDIMAKHGVENTAKYSGLSVRTLLVYVRAKTPISISEKAVNQAEWVISELS